ncbi:MAG: hypothetical protein MZV70_06240 [Desulfobacterales bacterium]|nr:hypothetical protein [Desulfobacterales bacterium]
MAGRVEPRTGLLYVLKYFEYFIVFFMLVNHVRDGAAAQALCVLPLPDRGHRLADRDRSRSRTAQRLSAPVRRPGSGSRTPSAGYLLFVGMVAAGLAAKVQRAAHPAPAAAAHRDACCRRFSSPSRARPTWPSSRRSWCWGS